MKAELPDDQRALKEDWDASAATRLTTRPCVCACVRVCGKKELMHRTFSPVLMMMMMMAHTIACLFIRTTDI